MLEVCFVMSTSRYLTACHCHYPHGCTNPTGSTILVLLKDGKFMKVLRCAFFAQQFYVQKIRLQLSDVKESHGDCLAERAAIGCTGAAWH